LERDENGRQLAGKSKSSFVIEAEERPIEKNVDGFTKTGQTVCHIPEQSNQSEQDHTQYTESTIAPIFNSEWQVNRFAFKIVMTHLQGDGLRLV
jgi:hypothetical protein